MYLGVYLDWPCRAAVDVDPKPTAASANTAMNIRRGMKLFLNVL